jgi:hypothetical protein
MRATGPRQAPVRFSDDVIVGKALIEIQHHRLDPLGEHAGISIKRVKPFDRSLYLCGQRRAISSIAAYICRCCIPSGFKHRRHDHLYAAASCLTEACENACVEHAVVKRANVTRIHINAISIAGEQARSLQNRRYDNDDQDHDGCCSCVRRHLRGSGVRNPGHEYLWVRVAALRHFGRTGWPLLPLRMQGANGALRGSDPRRPFDPLTMAGRRNVDAWLAPAGPCRRSANPDGRPIFSTRSAKRRHAQHRDNVATARSLGSKRYEHDAPTCYLRSGCDPRSTDGTYDRSADLPT